MSVSEEEVDAWRWARRRAATAAACIAASAPG